jgi:ABC-type Fe3+-hydroxamate transport system substrate-binding protein
MWRMRLVLGLFFGLLAACRMQPAGEDPPSSGSAKGAESVTVTAKFDFGGCPDSQPFRVAVTNGTDKRLKSVSYRLSLIAVDKPDDLMSPGDADRVWTKELAPKATDSECQSVPSMKTNDAIPANKMPTVKVERRKVEFR